MGNAGMMCTQTGLDTTTLNGYKSGFSFNTNGMIETVTLMHMQLVALAFACNYNRVAALQWGDGTDGTHYQHPFAKSIGSWTFHQISHRVMSRRCHRERSDRRSRRTQRSTCSACRRSRRGWTLSTRAASRTSARSC